MVAELYMSRHSFRRTDNGCTVIFPRRLQCFGTTYLTCWVQHGQTTTMVSYALLLFFHFESFSTKTAAFFAHVQDLTARLLCCLMKRCISSLRSWTVVNMPPWLALRST